MAGYSGTPLPKKLGIREGNRVATLQAPEHLPSILTPWPAGARIEELPRDGAPTSEDDRFDVILAFVDDEVGLRAGLASAPDWLRIAGGLWIGWPKMKSALFRGLKESHVREAGLATGLVDNKVCAIDGDWSGLRFVVRREDRPALEAARGAG